MPIIKRPYLSVKICEDFRLIEMIYIYNKTYRQKREKQKMGIVTLSKINGKFLLLKTGGDQRSYNDN